MIAESLSEIEKFIKKEKYKEPDRNEPEQDYSIINWLEEARNTSDKFKAIIEMTKFYGIPFLYEYRVVYSQMREDEKRNLASEMEELTLLATDMLGDDVPKELEFLFLNRHQNRMKNRSVPQLPKPTERQRKFLDCWRAARKTIGVIESLPADQVVEKLRLIDEYLEKGGTDDDTLNTFEKRVIQVYDDKITRLQEPLTLLVRKPQNPSIDEPKDTKEEPDQGEYGRTVKFEVPNFDKEENTSPPNNSFSKIRSKVQDNSSPQTIPPADPSNRVMISGVGNMPQGIPQEIPQEIPQKSHPYAQQQIHQIRTPLCCKRSFYKGEVIEQSESMTLEFKNYSYPWNEDLKCTLLKAITGFLNRNGGILLIGVQQNNTTKRPIIVPSTYNETAKEQIQFDLTKMLRSVYPDVLSNNKVDAQFVPVRSETTHDYIKGAFIIRIIIEYGERDRVYYFNYGNKDYFPFRAQKQVLDRGIQAALDEQISRARKPLEIPPKPHIGACMQPEIGKPIYGDPTVEGTLSKPRTEKQFKMPAWNNEAKQYNVEAGWQQQALEKKRPAVPPQKQPIQNAQHQPPQKISKPLQNPKQAQQQGGSNLNKRDFISRVVIKLPQDFPTTLEFITGDLHSSVRFSKNNTMAFVRFLKSQQDIFKRNIQNFKRYPLAQNIMVIIPTAVLEFRGAQSHDMFMEATKLVGKIRQIRTQCDKQAELIRFRNIDECVGMFLHLADSGLFPRFSNK